MKQVVPLLLIVWLAGAPLARVVPAQAAVGRPALLWSNKGCYSSWCENAWYSSPAAADLDGDGQVEVIGAGESLFVLDGATGSLEWRVTSGYDRRGAGTHADRIFPDVVVADLDGNGDLEIVTGHENGQVSVYDHQGYFQPGWPQQPTPGNEIRSLGVFDLDGNGDLEIMAASTRSYDQWFVYEHDGRLRTGAWPEHDPDSETNGFSAGCYNQNLAAGDLDGDGRAEIIGPNDMHYIVGFYDDGRQMRANAIYGRNPDGSLKVWSRVGFHVDHAVDLRGYAHCEVDRRPNFAYSAPVIMDVDGNGTQEVVVVGNIYDCSKNPYQSLYHIPYILNSDRTRWQAGGFDWTALPQPEPGSAPLMEDYNRIENAHPNPVLADLDGDGKMEILYPSYDGRVHAFWLDKSEHGAWPYRVTRQGEGLVRFASEPVVADLDGSGQAEVLFTSWVEKGSYQTGFLHLLDAQGNLLWEVSLPAPFGTANWNGGLAAPTIANIDGDADYEVLVNTFNSGMAAYDLPGSGDARLHWHTGRGSYQRSGSLGSLNGSVMMVDPPNPKAGELVTVTTVLRSSGPAVRGAAWDNPLPGTLSFAGSLTASEGIAGYAGGAVHWEGDVAPNRPVTVRYQARIDAATGDREVITNSAAAREGAVRVWNMRAVAIVNGLGLYLPAIFKSP